MWDGAFGAVGFGTLSTIMVILYSIEYNTSLENPNVYISLVFTGYCQKVDTGYLTIKINAGTTDCKSNGYIDQDIHKHNGQPTGPALEEILAMWNLPPGVIYTPIGMDKREWEFMMDQGGKGVLDYLSDWDGLPIWMNEYGKLTKIPPGVMGTNPEYTGRMKAPSQSESAVGFCNKVIVRGGSFVNAKDPGAVLLPAKAVGYVTTITDLEDILANDAGEGGAAAASDMIANYGWILAPTFFFPECTTDDECHKRAVMLLARYITYWKRAVPAVVGRTPKLYSGIAYKYPKLIEMLWQLSTLQVGWVVRAKTNYSPQTGWVCFTEIHPFGINASMTEKIYEDVKLGK
jgi:hypothetical protein